ncbi:MAG: MgtC/SapB family protein [Chloroflexi bacterium]|nr:MgtC/SapB family protein [Chloroflexota bacterium]
MDIAPPVTPWEHLPTLARLGLALAVGLFVGLERERRGKEAGLRTFGFAALLGGLGGLLGENYGPLSIALLGVLVAFLNWQALRFDGGAELTTSAALLVTGFNGLLAGQGHTFTPVAVAVMSAALLAWKERLAGFSLGLTEVELRSAILLGILAFVIYPILPEAPIDPWGLIEPRAAWVTVILIAALGFVNYILLKMYGARGVELAGFLGGLVNSTVTVTEMATRVRETGGRLVDAAYRGVVLSTMASTVRNALLLGVLASSALVASLLPLALMVGASLALALLSPRHKVVDSHSPALNLSSPFSLQSALKFGVIFLVLEVAGILAQRMLGQTGFYAVSAVGGLVSSASAVASAASLVTHGLATPAVAGTGAVLASLSSAVINLLLVARVSGDRALTVRVTVSIAIVIALGCLGIAGENLLPVFALPVH